MTIDWNEFLSIEAKLRVKSVMQLSCSKDTISLFAGMPHPDCFPIKSLSFNYLSPESDFNKLKQLSIDGSENGKIVEALQYLNTKGTSFLRGWCSKHIMECHQPGYNSWDFLIQAGATQSTDSVLRMVCDPGDSVLVDNFTYPCFVETCKPLRLNVVPVDILDDNGVDPVQMDDILSNWETGKYKSMMKPKMYYVVPVGQNPLGYTMSVERKRQVYEVCSKHNILILEDDPYYHLQLNNTLPVASFLKLDTQGRVIRIDSFSKILMPGVRCSILTTNKQFIENISLANDLSIHTASGPSQLILYKLLNTWHEDHDGGFGSWLASLQSHYTKRRDILLDAFEKHVPKELCSWNKPVSGMFIWLEVNLEKFPKLDNSQTDAEWCTEVEDLIFDSYLKNCVSLAKGHWFIVDKSTQKIGFRASYAFPEEEEFLKAGERVGTALKEIHEKLYG